MYDAIVIGSGISGASVARELAKYNVRTLVLEKGSDLCSGATRGNSATVHSGHDATYGTNKAIYNVLGNAMYDEICRDLNVPFVRNGMIIYATDSDQVATIKALKENANKNGVPGVKILSRKELLQMEGYFGDDVVAGLYAPTSGMVCPYTMVIAMCENACENGVMFSLNEEVKEIKRTSFGYTIKTNKNTYETKYVFNCAGTHADEMNNMVSDEKIKIIPRKGEHIILDKKLAGFVKATISQTPIDLPGGGHTKGMGIMPSVDGTIILGCDAHEVEDKDDSSTTKVALDEIKNFFIDNWRYLPISKAFPRFPSNYIIGAFGGIRPHPENDDFIIGEAFDAKGFFNVAGIESPGLTAAPAVARKVVGDAAKKYGFGVNKDFTPVRKHPKPFREMSEEERVEAVDKDSDYGKIICRCEQVTKAEIKQAIHSVIPAKSVNAVKMRTRAGMGRCQGGFCSPEVAKILSEELGIDMLEVTQLGEGSNILACETGETEDN